MTRCVLLIKSYENRRNSNACLKVKLRDQRYLLRSQLCIEKKSCIPHYSYIRLPSSPTSFSPIVAPELPYLWAESDSRFQANDLLLVLGVGISQDGVGSLQMEISIMYKHWGVLCHILVESPLAN